MFSQANFPRSIAYVLLRILPNFVMFCGVSFGCCGLYSFPESTLPEETSTPSGMQWLDSCQALSEGCACVQPFHWCMLLNDLNADAVVTFVQFFFECRSLGHIDTVGRYVNQIQWGNN